MNTIGLDVLRAKIRGFQAAGETIAHRIKKVSGKQRWSAWDAKRRLGGYNREHLIAYGLLRGVPYVRIERCAKRNAPNVSKILELMKAHADPTTASKLTLEGIKMLLEVPEGS